MNKEAEERLVLSVVALVAAWRCNAHFIERAVPHRSQHLIHKALIPSVDANETAPYLQRE